MNLKEAEGAETARTPQPGPEHVRTTEAAEGSDGMCKLD